MLATSSKENLNRSCNTNAPRSAGVSRSRHSRLTTTASHPRMSAISSRSARARRANVVFQDSVVDQPLTGRRNLEIHARLWGVEAAEVRRRIADVADAFGLTDLHDRAVASYSGGQRRRLEIARALLSRPQVLFLDEPTVGLDPRIRFELLDLIARLRGRD